MPRLLYVLLAVWALVMYWELVMSVWTGRAWLAPLYVLLASPILLAVLRRWVEGGSWVKMFDPRKQGWSFEFGDTFAFTSAVFFAALAWATLPGLQQFKTAEWVVGSFGLGLVAGAVFHWLDSKAYRAVGAEASLKTATKLAHDFVAYPVLFGGVLCVGVPLLFVRSWHTWAVVACVGVWLVLAVADGLRAPNPHWLHPA